MLKLTLFALLVLLAVVVRADFEASIVDVDLNLDADVDRAAPFRSAPRAAPVRSAPRAVAPVPRTAAKPAQQKQKGCGFFDVACKAKEAAKNLQNFEKDVQKNVGNFQKDVKKNIGNTVKNVRNFEKDVNRNVGKAVKQAQKNFGNFQKDVKKNIGNTVKSVRRFEKDVQKNVGKAVKVAQKNFGNFQKDVQKNVRRFENDVKKNVANAVKKVRKDINDFKKDVKKNGLMHAVADATAKTAGEVGKVVSTVSKVIRHSRELKFALDLVRKGEEFADHAWTESKAATKAFSQALGQVGKIANIVKIAATDIASCPKCTPLCHACRIGLDELQNMGEVAACGVAVPAACQIIGLGPEDPISDICAVGLGILCTKVEEKLMSGISSTAICKSVKAC